MKHFAVCVRDEAVGAFNRPFFVPSIGMAMRSFTDEVNRVSEDNPMYRHPKDFALYHVGFFDDELGVFEVLDMPDRLCNAVNVVVKPNLGGGSYETVEAEGGE